jgi:tetratricopeptide (TPR) repeat protein
LTLYDNIGLVYSKKGDLETALLQHQRALEIRTRVFGSEHTSVADSLFNLALVYEKKEEWEKVVDCYQQVYNIARFLDRTIHRSRKH